jgi:4-carboxymuconolactone decarboxylase
MSTDQFERGLKVRKEVLGEDHVKVSFEGADNFNRDFQNMVTEYCWGGTWGQGILPKRERSILNLGMLAALNRQTEFKHHFKGALNNGLSLEDLREVLFQIACYCGIPAGVEAFRSAREVLKAEGIDTTGLDPR